jgi:hypothetical protein
MATAVREFSLDHHLFERLRFCGVERENLNDLIGIVVSLKNKYGIVPFAIAAENQPVPSAITVRYQLDSVTLNKVFNVILDTPRLCHAGIVPRGIPRPTQFEVTLTLGG